MAGTHTTLADSERPAPQHAKRRRAVHPKTLMDLTITLKGPDLPSPKHMPRKALSREEIAKMFGVPKATVERVARVLESSKLKVVEVTQGGRSLKVRGSAAAITKAFRPKKFGMYELPGEGLTRAREGE